jgi:Xaa-Pro aminopeptidase
VVVVPNAGEAPQRPLEQRREGRTRRNAAENGVAVSQSEALRKAAVALGMTKGRIGCDSPQGSDAWRMLGAVSDGVELVPALATISRIRLVKTPQEIAWMRYAALSNAAAASGACAAVRAGANSRELRQTFFAEAARRGGVPAWIAIDGVAAEAYTEDFRPGQAFMIDAVSTYSGYHGDFGRTVFVGEPQAHMRQHTDAIRLAWEAVRERLRPGLRFSEIQTIGQQALDKAPYRTVVRITPHSVGVLHTDAIGIGDIALEPGMIISVDFPVLESGIGGSAHLEDLTLITADGHELLNPATHPTITV